MTTPESGAAEDMRARDDGTAHAETHGGFLHRAMQVRAAPKTFDEEARTVEIGRASWRERV